MLGWYLLAALLLQCLAALPAGLQTGRHTHVDGRPGGLQTALLARWVHGVAGTVHSHDGYEHAHGATTSDVQPLGEEQDAGASLQLVTSAPWPASALWALVVTGERFGQDTGALFSSRCCAVPLQPPRPTGVVPAAQRG